MEFKDKLRKIRTENNLSRQALADAINVSRSAVAKWERGLEYPDEISYKALIQYFQVDENYFKTEEVDDIIVVKNKKIFVLHKVSTVLGIISVGTVLVLMIMFGRLVISKNYGFTSKMAAGSFADNECIELEDYDIYWYSITSPEEMKCIDGFRPVKKTFYGYVVNEEDYLYKMVYCNGEIVAILYSIKGENGYYNILKKMQKIIPDENMETSSFDALWMVDEVKIEDSKYEVLHNSFFITEEIVTEFYIKDNHFVVDEVIGNSR
ncbi:MAG: helix-turn-helix transcriptional regulator [Lachnospiraceae bacterium]|nr:helix-turn-helix transcriptional regulator [Lachnospiraceae bacterium]